jgi:hypothetical protein
VKRIAPSGLLMLPKWGRGAVSPLVPSPSRSRMYPTSADLKMCRTRASPSSVRERAQWCAHELEWVRGLREEPLTPCRRWQHRAALSRKGRGHSSRHRACGANFSTARRVQCASLIAPYGLHPTIAPIFADPSGVVRVPRHAIICPQFHRLWRHMLEHTRGDFAC